MQRQCGGALGRAEVGISGTHGQAVRFSYCGNSDNIDVKIQIRNHPTNHSQLLVVFFPEKSEMGFDDIEEFRDHRSHASEKNRPGKSAKMKRESLQVDISLESLPIQLLSRGMKYRIHAFASSKPSPDEDKPAVLGASTKEITVETESADSRNRYLVAGLSALAVLGMGAAAKAWRR